MLSMCFYNSESLILIDRLASFWGRRRHIPKTDRVDLQK